MIQLKQVSFGYKRRHKLFSDLNLELSRGSIVGLLGRNGEGKSTLMKLITGQLLAQSGEVRSLGISTQKRPAKLLQQVFMLPEEMTTPRLTVREYFDIIAPFYPTYDEQIANELMQAFGVEWSWHLGKISLGQRKKAMIALALSLRTPILLLDEPTNGLDIPSKSVFRQVLAKYSSEEQLIIISTHQVRDLEQLIDHIVMLDANRVVCNHSIAQLSERLHFGVLTPDNSARVLYREGSIMGEYGVWPADEQGQESENFSMELFFNAMIASPEQVKNCIND